MRLGDFRRRFLGDVVVAYNRVKSARRLIRAAGIDPKSTRTFDAAAISVFNAQLNVLTDAELDIEELRREAKSRGTAFSNKSEVVAALAALESYVSRIGEDQEKHPWEIGEGTPMTKLVRVGQHCSVPDERWLWR